MLYGEGLTVADQNKQRTREEERQESIYKAERNPGNVFHDAVIIFTVFAMYTVFLFMGRTPAADDENDL